MAIGSGFRNYYCEECGELSEELEECGGQDLCPTCAFDWANAEEYERQVREDYRAAAL